MQVRTSKRGVASAMTAMAMCGMLLAPGCRDGEQPVDGKATAKQETKPQAKPKAKSRSKQAPPAVMAAGTVLATVLQSTVDTGKATVGERVTLHTAVPIQVTEETVVPAGSLVHGSVTHVRAAGRMKGAAELTLRFTEIALPNGKTYEIACAPIRLVSKGDGKETAAEIGGGAAAGGLLAGVIGGKDDILKGAAIGAAVGTGVAVATKGEQIVLPAGKSLEIRLTAPLDLGPRSTS
jgi:hypothetical protein